jgi:hypothetical protein
MNFIYNEVDKGKLSSLIREINLYCINMVKLETCDIFLFIIAGS